MENAIYLSIWHFRISSGREVEECEVRRASGVDALCCFWCEVNYSTKSILTGWGMMPRS